MFIFIKIFVLVAYFVKSFRMLITFFTCILAKKQRFSIPESIVYYLTKNPISFQTWKKLIRTCKYFFSKNPLIVIGVCENRPDLINTPLAISLNQSQVQTHNDVKTIQFKLWITNYLTKINLHPARISTFIQKVYRFDIKALILHDVTITFGEFCFLTASNVITILKLFNVTVERDDGSMLELGKILKRVPLVRTFR